MYAGCRNSGQRFQELDTSANQDRGNYVGQVTFSLSKEVTFQVELAKTVEERARGLMFRRHLEPRHGMLFLFDERSQHSFYMKNTYIPLDIVFMDRIEEGVRVVGILKNMRPLDEISRYVDAPSTMALEIPAGQADALGIKNGVAAKIVLPSSPNG
ncbi:MAG: hypothetical protein CMH54_12850 [Myxococcales bacterium]|nr:hypothetical protein [Myxococcales bacterium]|tara:strand:- start:113 stop:580 length:468 start_codon:yes stop_codon:yes gene_type:complete